MGELEFLIKGDCDGRNNIIYNSNSGCITLCRCQPFRVLTKDLQQIRCFKAVYRVVFNLLNSNAFVCIIRFINVACFYCIFTLDNSQ